MAIANALIYIASGLDPEGLFTGGWWGGGGGVLRTERRKPQAGREYDAETVRCRNMQTSIYILICASVRTCDDSLE